MHFWIQALSIACILSTAVVFGTDMFFLTIGRTALKLASTSAGTEVMGFFHMIADTRMPMWGAMAILSDLLLAAFGGSERSWLYGASLLLLIMFVILYNRVSKPINRIQIEAAQAGATLENGRELQAAWDRVLFIRVPLLGGSLLAQCLALRLSL